MLRGLIATVSSAICSAKTTASCRRRFAPRGVVLLRASEVDARNADVRPHPASTAGG
jgi:hypothetical protein